MDIIELTKKYSSKINISDIEIIISHCIKKPREFVLAHPEYQIPKNQASEIRKKVQRRIQGEPIAYITGHKEFYGLDFIVNEHTLIPRPETELLIEQAVQESGIRNQELDNTVLIDVGTGSGNIIISIVKNISRNCNSATASYYAIDISKDALKIARKNAKLHGVDKKIKLLHGNLLSPFLKPTSQGLKDVNLILLANLPYLSKDIYLSAPKDVRSFEPKTALYSPEQGLQHYRKLLLQAQELIATHSLVNVSCILEISPEQKKILPALIKSIAPKAKISFLKDLAGKWRICKIKLQTNSKRLV